jgi:hypothetical protein
MEHGKGQANIDLDIEANNLLSQNEEELIVNSETAEFCVRCFFKRMRSFYLRKTPFFSERVVLAFSKSSAASRQVDDDGIHLDWHPDRSGHRGAAGLRALGL